MLKRSIAALFTLCPSLCLGQPIIPELSQQFFQYIKDCENDIQAGWDGQRWHIYNDGSGDHIAYGHKVKEGEDFSQGLTESEAQSLLLEDLKIAYVKAWHYFHKRDYDLNTFSDREKEIVLDFTFNGCLLSHPKMMMAVAESNLETQRLEYKRYAVLNGQRVELKQRNQRFKNLYLKE